MTNTPVKDPKAEVAKVRRSPLTNRDKISVHKRDPNYHYRLVNVDKDRVDEFIERGYEIDPQGQVGDARVDSAAPLGGFAQISVGGGMKAVMMRQKWEYFQEDQKIKQQQVNELEASMNEDAKKLK